MVDGIVWLRGDFADAKLNGKNASIEVLINFSHLKRWDQSGPDSPEG
jgi:hypothetical protein